MKRTWVSLTLFALCVLSFTLFVDATPSYPSFSGFATDPIDADGIYGSELTSYLNSGWELKTTTVDFHNQLVQFRGSTGQPEWRIGTIPQGTKFLYNSTLEIEKIQQCGNIRGDTEQLKLF